jgi:acyl-CoA thioesterase-1
MLYFHKVRRAMPVLFWSLFLMVFNPAESWAEPVILALGDSLTAGYGVPEAASYPSRLQKLLKEQGYPHRVVNAGVSGDTTAGGARRIDWLMQHEPAIVILELGANDSLRGVPVTEMEANLIKIVEVCRKKGAKVLLAGMKALPNYGPEYSEAFEGVFTRVAEKFKLSLIPFFLEGVAARRELTQDDGIHPVAEGYATVTETVWKYLQPMLVK